MSVLKSQLGGLVLSRDRSSVAVSLEDVTEAAWQCVSKFDPLKSKLEQRLSETKNHIM